MKVTWQVQDGYAGKSRPQYTEVPDDELAECNTDEARQRLIEEYVDDDFKNTVTWEITKQE